MRVIDINYAAFKRDLDQQGRGLQFGSDVAVLGVTAAAAASTVAATARVLAAIGAGIVGTRAAFENDVLVRQTIMAILDTMEAKRDSIAVDIANAQIRTADQFTLIDAMRMVDNYEDAGSIVEAVRGITESASVSARIARNDRRVLSGVARTSAADRLNAYIDAGRVPATSGARLATLLEISRDLGFSDIQSADDLTNGQGPKAEERRLMVLEKLRQRSFMQ
jgi:hypothetical protein